MEHLDVDYTESGFHISGFPDAVKVIKLSGPKGKQISDLASHRFDLLLALDSLEGINDVPLERAVSAAKSLAISHCTLHKVLQRQQVQIGARSQEGLQRRLRCHGNL